MGGATLISRREHFPVVGSTNDVVAEWLAAGTPEICVATADVQSAGRGRYGRTWTAPAGAALLLSLGFTPTWLRPEHVWRLAAVVSVAMAEAAEIVAGLAVDTIRLKWPNDLVAMLGPRESRSSASDLVERDPVQRDGWHLRKVAGVLGETTGLGTHDPRAVIGVGTNVDWARNAFPPPIATEMTSLRDLAGRSVDREELLEAFLGQLEGLIVNLGRDVFDSDAWQRRQLTNNARVRLDLADGRIESAIARRVDPETGGLVVEADGVERTVLAGEIHHLRIAADTSVPAVKV